MSTPIYSQEGSGISEPWVCVVCGRQSEDQGIFVRDKYYHWRCHAEISKPRATPAEEVLLAQMRAGTHVCVPISRIKQAVREERAAFAEQLEMQTKRTDVTPPMMLIGLAMWLKHRIASS